MQQPVGVVGVGGHAAAARPQRADDRQRAEQVVGQAVHGPAELGLDAVHDRRRVGRDRAGVVGRRAARRRRRACSRGPPTRRGTSTCTSGRRAGGVSARMCSLRPQWSTSERRAGSSASAFDHLGPRHLHELAAARPQDPVGARGVRLQPVPRGEIDDDVPRIGLRSRARARAAPSRVQITIRTLTPALRR